MCAFHFLGLRALDCPKVWWQVVPDKTSMEDWLLVQSMSLLLVIVRVVELCGNLKLLFFYVSVEDHFGTFLFRYHSFIKFNLLFDNTEQILIHLSFEAGLWNECLLGESLRFRLLELVWSSSPVWLLIGYLLWLIDTRRKDQSCRARP